MPAADGSTLIFAWGHTTMIYHHCPRCGKRIPTGQTCSCLARIKRERDRVYDATKRNKTHTAFYASSDWITLRDDCRGRYANLDIYALYADGRITPGRVAHHIIPLDDDWTKRLAADNLIYVSDSSHQLIHKAYSAGDDAKRKMQKTLREYQRRWRDEAKPSG